MRSVFRAVVAAAVGFCIFAGPPASAQQADAPTPLPVALEEYGELPDVEDASLSVSGNRIAVLTTVQGTRALLVIEDQTRLASSFAIGDMKVRYFEWIGDDRILLVSSMTQDLGYSFTTDKAEFYIGTILPITEGTEGGVIFANRRDLFGAIMGNYGIRQIDGRWYGFFGALELERRGRMEYSFDHGRPFLYRVDLQDFTARRIANAAPEGQDSDWLVDADGNLAATLEVSNTTGSWKLRNGESQTIAQGTNPLGRIGLIGLGYDGTSALLSERNEDGIEWYEIPLAGGTLQPFLREVDVDRLYFDDLSGHLMGYLEGGASPRPVLQDPAHQDAARKVRRAFADSDMRMVDWTRDFGDVVVRTSGNFDSGTWFAVDLASLRANAVAYERTAIGPDQVGPISVVQYTASDGLEMDGILTLPPGRDPRGLPAIVMPHGGPHSHDTKSFDWWAQAFASRGYAVFQPNFRGSTNRSGEFRSAGYGQWGRLMQTDKSDGLTALVQQGIVDPARVCIVGASYGGYAALAGVTLQQDIYRCAVAVAPVSDIGNMYREDYRASGREATTRASLLDQLGPREGWNEVSPLRAASRASAPIMLIHGRDDVVVPYSHSTRMADALKDAGKPHEFVTLDGEDHWLSRSQTRRQMLEAAVEFVERHNPPAR
ncbi:alpha/beta hydrolase family protein [Qipengyuania sp. ASV99]|uniref:alpha/beta hydrolase family protein n=1 Tax=Qipengyuania sp. ASV99 TaxID=3399681 RepID=UPI003A4C550E